MAKPLPDEIKEEIKALHTSGMTGADIARKLKVSESFVSRLIKAYKKEAPDEYETLRHQSKEKIVKEVWKSVEGLTTLLNRRVDTLLEHEEKLEKCVRAIGSDDELPDNVKKSMIRSLGEIMSPKLVEITTALGTAWDKVERSQTDIDTNEASGVVVLPVVATLEPPKESEEDEITTG